VCGPSDHGNPVGSPVLAVANKRLGHLFPQLPQQPGYFKRRRRLVDSLGWLLGVSPAKAPAFKTTCCSSTAPRSRAHRAAKRSGDRPSAMPPTTAGVPVTAAISGDFDRTRSSARRHTPRPAETDEREVAPKLLARCRRHGGQPSWATGATPAAHSPTPSTTWTPQSCVRRKDEPGQGPHLAPLRQRNESIFSCKTSSLSNATGARTLAGLRERVLQRFVCLAAAITILITSSAAPAAPPSTTAPDHADSTI